MSTPAQTRGRLRRVQSESILGQTAETTIALAERAEWHGRQLDALFERITRLELESRSRAALTFAGRLRWLLKGV